MANTDRQRETLLQTIESQAIVGGRFCDIQRLGPAGGGGQFSLLMTALDQLTGERVALKFFDPSQSSDHYRWECFRREPNVLMKFKGARDILQCLAPPAQFDLPFTHGSLTLSIKFAYYALELASHDVNAAILSDSLKPRDKLVTFRAMCRAVQRIHLANVAHRDLKPSNFLMMPDGTVRLSDFGTARDLNDAAGAVLLRYDSPPGDLMYSAPEIFAGLHDADPTFAIKADLYSLGAILFELFATTPLTLQVFRTSTLVDLMQIMKAVDPADRVAAYTGFISNLADANPLPSTIAYGTVPKCIGAHVDRLYRDLAAIDYRRRLSEFKQIFARLDKCLWVLEHEHKYQLWKLQRKKRLANQQRFDDHLGHRSAS